MNKKEFIYVSPAVAVKEMVAEGVLCSSTFEAQTLSIEEWETGQFSW